jgi:hypothetical protein
MKRFIQYVVLTLLLAVAVLPLSRAVASPGSGFNIPWYNVASGATSSNNSFSLISVAGQPDAQMLSGGTYTLAGGFLSQAGAGQSYLIFLPLVLCGD